MSFVDGVLTKAFAAAAVGGAASVVGVAVGLTAAPVVLPVAAAVAAGSIVVGGVSGTTLTIRALKEWANNW